MSQLILIRHGQTDWNRQKRIQGSLDMPLNEDGKKEAKSISGELANFKIDAVYSSPVSCSFNTASEVAVPHKVRVKKTKQLNDLDQGVWQGLLIDDVKKRYKKQYSLWKTSPTSGCPPKGESIKDASDRAISFVHKAVDQNKNGSICIVSGNIILSVIKCHLKNIELENMWKFIPDKIWWEAFEI